MTDHTSPSAKSAMIAPRLYLSFVAMVLAISGMMLAPQSAAAHDYHKHRKGNFAIQFHFGSPNISTRRVHRHQVHKPRFNEPRYHKKQHHRAVVHTCSPRKAKRIARKHYKLRHAQIVRVNHRKIVIAGNRRGHRERIAFGHYCQPLRR